MPPKIEPMKRNRSFNFSELPISRVGPCQAAKQPHMMNGHERRAQKVWRKHGMNCRQWPVPSFASACTKLSNCNEVRKAKNDRVSALLCLSNLVLYHRRKETFHQILILCLSIVLWAMWWHPTLLRAHCAWVENLVFSIFVTQKIVCDSKGEITMRVPAFLHHQSISRYFFLRAFPFRGD